MRRDGDEGGLAPLGAIAPEDAVGAGRAMLHVRVEDLRVRIVGVLNRVVFVCLKARVARVCLEKCHTPGHLFEEAFLFGRRGLLGLLSVLERLPGCRFKFVEGVR